MCCPQANAIKLITLNPGTSQKVQKISNRFWLAGILFSITHAALKVSFVRAFHCPRGINTTLWTKAGRLTKETREIRGLEEKNIGGENARKLQLQLLQT